MPDKDEYVLFTVVNPYPLNANMELSNDRLQFAQWIAAVTGDSGVVIALYHKPSASRMVLVSLTKTYQHHRRVLGRHYWMGPNGFLNQPPPDITTENRSEIFYCRYKLHSEATKIGWKCFEFTDRMFAPDVQAKLFRNPYPMTTTASVPPGDATTFDLCSPLPVALFPPSGQPRVPDAPVGSSTWHAIKKLQPAKPIVEAPVMEESGEPSVGESPKTEEPTDLWGGVASDLRQAIGAADLVSDLPLSSLNEKNNEDVCPYHGTTCKKMCAWRSAREKQKGPKIGGPSNTKNYNANKAKQDKFPDTASSNGGSTPGRPVTTPITQPSALISSPRNSVPPGLAWGRDAASTRGSNPGSPVVSSSTQSPIHSGEFIPASPVFAASPSPWQPITPAAGRGASPASARGAPVWSSRGRGRGRGTY